MKKIFIGFALLLASIILVKAEGISFPVSELGNCSDKESCRAYCDETANMDACIKFAEDRGLMNKSEAEQGRNFHARIISGEGPGGCQGLKECRAYCGDTANLEICLAFAKEQGIKDDNVKEGEKILKFLKAGGAMPGGCASKESCREYCGEFSHAEECADFAEKAGITRPRVNSKFLEIAKNGGPGGCKNKDACETYCADPVHRTECLDFASRAGILGEMEVENIRNSGITGPGGCASEVSCRMYCDNPVHREECFKFAEEHGYMTKDEAVAAKDGVVSLRAGLEQAPPEIAGCLRSTLGENIIEKIQTGDLTPGPEIGARVKACFEKFGRAGKPAEVLRNAPSAVNACLKAKLGTDFNKLKADTLVATPEMADTVRVCFQRNEIQESDGLSAEMHDPADSLRSFLKTAPPGILPCIKATLGEDLNKILAGENIPIDTGTLKTCFDNFHPTELQPAVSGGGSSSMFQNLPPDKLECVKKVLGDDFLKLQAGRIKPTAEMELRLRPCFTAAFPSPTPTRTLPPVDLSGFPTGVAICIKEKIGSDAQSFFTQPDAGSKFEMIVKACTITVLPTPTPATTIYIMPVPTLEPPPIYIIPTPPPTPTGTSAGTVCIQVLTPARDPATGYCKVFATPCNVPYGWVKVDRCETVNTNDTYDGTIQPSTTTISPTSYAPPAFSVASVFTPILSVFGLISK